MSTLEPSNYEIIYVFTNPAMPGLVKIGMTPHDNIEKHLRELYNASIPFPFECQFACKVDLTDCSQVERALHTAFHPNRINLQRDYFEIDAEQVIVILRLLERSEDITAELKAEMNKDLTLDDKIAIERFTRSRRLTLRYNEMNIPTGSELQFRDNSSIKVTVLTDRKVLHNGMKISLTAVTRELLGLDYSVQPTPYWTYNGRSLQDIYNETYTVEEE